MSPAFSSTRHAVIFAGILLLVLLLPWLAGKTLLPPREQAYSSLGRDLLDYPYIHQQIFEEKGDIDIVFMGGSRMGCTIDAASVQRALSEKLGRPAVVRSLTWTWNGFDPLYFIAQDLLAHRRVRMLVFDDLSADPGKGNTAHRQASAWFRFGDNAQDIAGLPLRSQITFYGSAMIGLPRNLVGLLRPNDPPTDQPAFDHYHVPFDYTPQTTATPEDVRIGTTPDSAGFQFADAPVPAMQMAFIRKIGALAQAQQTQLVFLREPVLAARHDTLLKEPDYWPAEFGAPVPMVGIPPAALFAGLTDAEVGKLYFNEMHFNQNGKNYFTRLVTPALIQTYEDQIKP